MTNDTKYQTPESMAEAILGDPQPGDHSEGADWLCVLPTFEAVCGCDHGISDCPDWVAAVENFQDYADGATRLGREPHGFIVRVIERKPDPDFPSLGDQSYPGSWEWEAITPPTQQPAA